MDRKLINWAVALLIFIAIFLYLGYKDHQRQQQIRMEQVEAISPK